MSYNQKIVRTRSYVEVWDYEKPILSHSNSNFDEKIVESVPENDTHREAFEELTSDKRDERIKRMKKTRLEAKFKLQRLIDTNYDNRTSFLTLTTKEKIENRDIFNKLFHSFINRFTYQVLKTKKRELKYVCVYEKQKRGAFHAHILLFNVPFVPHQKILKIWGLGGVRINKLSNLDDSSNAGRYVSKYMEKGMDQELLENFGKKAFLNSRNLIKPDETKIFLKDPLEFDDSLVIYKNEYYSRVYKDGDFVLNKVKYRKIKIKEDV